MLNRKGRKRRSGQRTAAGRIIARKPVDYRALAAAQPHRKWLPAAVRGDERAESVLGCLSLLWRIHEAKNAKAVELKQPTSPNQYISEEMYEAGRRFSVIVGSFRQAIGISGNATGSGRSYACEPSACARDRSNCLCEIRTAKYRDATRVLVLAGQKAYNVTYQVAVSDMAPSDEQLADLRCGLLALAVAFGLTGRRKS